MGRHRINEIQKSQTLSPVPGMNHPLHHYRLDTAQLVSSFAEKDPGILVDSNLDTGQQCSLAAGKANSMLDCIKQNFSS